MTFRSITDLGQLMTQGKQKDNAIEEVHNKSKMMATQYEQQISEAKLEVARQEAKSTAELHEMESNKNKIEAQVLALSEKLKIQDDTITSKGEEIASLMEQLKRKRMKLAEYKRQISTLQGAELSQLQGKHENLASEIKQIEEEYEKQCEEIQKLRNVC